MTLAPGPDGKPGGSYQFSGSSTSYITLNNNGKLDTRYSMTILVWVYPKSNGPILNYNTNLLAVHFWIVSGLKLFVRFQVRAYSILNAQSYNLAANTWSYVGASYDYSTGLVKLWIDGNTVIQANIGVHEMATQDSLRMGAITSDSRYFRGRISCLQVYDRPLSQEQIQAAQDLCQRTGKAVVHDVYYLVIHDII